MKVLCKNKRTKIQKTKKEESKKIEEKDKTRGRYTHNLSYVWNTLVVESHHHRGAQHDICPKGWEVEQVVPTLLQTPPCPISKLKCDSGGFSKI